VLVGRGHLLVGCIGILRWVVGSGAYAGGEQVGCRPSRGLVWGGCSSWWGCPVWSSVELGSCAAGMEGGVCCCRHVVVFVGLCVVGSVIVGLVGVLWVGVVGLVVGACGLWRYCGGAGIWFGAVWRGCCVVCVVICARYAALLGSVFLGSLLGVWGECVLGPCVLLCCSSAGMGAGTVRVFCVVLAAFVVPCVVVVVGGLVVCSGPVWCVAWGMILPVCAVGLVGSSGVAGMGVGVVCRGRGCYLVCALFCVLWAALLGCVVLRSEWCGCGGCVMGFPYVLLLVYVPGV
jgi:hypothetical protein